MSRVLRMNPRLTFNRVVHPHKGHPFSAFVPLFMGQRQEKGSIAVRMSPSVFESTFDEHPSLRKFADVPCTIEARSLTRRVRVSSEDS